MRVVISQSMYFPWLGFLEQIALSDVYVYYDDVQFTKGFYNRVQVKTPYGRKWLTVPTRNKHQGQRIDEVFLDDSDDWRGRHLCVLREFYRMAPFYRDMMEVAEEGLSRQAEVLSDISRSSVMALARYFDLDRGHVFVDSRDLGVHGKGTRRLLDIVKLLGGDTYITGHGAKNYLDHELFEDEGIEVRYMKYACKPYLQQHGKFTPYVTALDVVANCGKKGRELFVSDTVNWKEFIG